MMDTKQKCLQVLYRYRIINFMCKTRPHCVIRDVQLIPSPRCSEYVHPTTSIHNQLGQIFKSFHIALHLRHLTACGMKPIITGRHRVYLVVTNCTLADGIRAELW